MLSLKFPIRSNFFKFLNSFRKVIPESSMRRLLKFKLVKLSNAGKTLRVFTEASSAMVSVAVSDAVDIVAVVVVVVIVVVVVVAVSERFEFSEFVSELGSFSGVFSISCFINFRLAFMIFLYSPFDPTSTSSALGTKSGSILGHDSWPIL